MSDGEMDLPANNGVGSEEYADIGEFVNNNSADVNMEHSVYNEGMDFNDATQDDNYMNDAPGGTNDGSFEEDEDAIFDEDLPVFASRKNKELNKIVKRKEKKLESIERKNEELSERTRIMAEHLKNVKQEHSHTQSLVDAKLNEIKTEDHLKALSEREKGRIQQEIRNLEGARNDLTEKLNIVQNSIFRGNEKMDRFRLQMNWNQEELEQWALAAKQKEEDNLALQKYTRADEARIKQLNLEIEKVTVSVSEKKALLEMEVTETQAKQIELDKTAEEFRQLHTERQRLITQWQEAIEAMKKRDLDIQKVGESYAEELEEIANLRKTVSANEKLYKQHVQENADMDSNLTFKDRQVGMTREEYGKVRAGQQSFKDDVEVLRNQLAKAAAEVVRFRSEKVNRLNVMTERNLALEKEKLALQAVQKKLELAGKGKLTAEEAVTAAESDLRESEMKLKAAQKGIANVKDVMFKKSQELFKLRQNEANLIAEISGAQAASRSLSSKIAKLDQNALRQQELIYNAEFQIQQLERKVARASGVRSDEEKQMLNARIAVLTEELSAANEQKKMLNSQVKKLEEELRAAVRKVVTSTADKEKLTEEINELELKNTSAEQTYKQKQLEKEETMVNHDILKLEVKRLRDVLSSRADEVFGLENRKFQLSMSMEERKQEIAIHQQIQRAQSKGAEEERHKVAVELQERNMKLESLKAKFETLVKSFAIRDGEGEEKSQAYYVIKAAQKREELQREGDELDSKIRIAEREVRALEKTLAHLNDKNESFRAGFHRADMTGPEAQALRQFEDKCKAASDLLFKKRKELQRLHTEYEEDKKRHDQVQEQMAQMRDHVDHLRTAIQQVEVEVAEAQDRQESSRQRVEDIKRKHRQAHNVPVHQETLDEKRIRAETVLETNQNILYTLGELAREFPQMQESLKQNLAKVGLKIPSKPPSSVISNGTTGKSEGASGSRSSNMGSRMSSRNDEIRQATTPGL